jgi:hypothetical protein
LLQRLVIKTKSVEYMPFLLSLAVFLCGTSWFVYGLLGRDPFVAVSTLVLEDPAVPCDRSMLLFSDATVDNDKDQTTALSLRKL